MSVQDQARAFENRDDSTAGSMRWRAAFDLVTGMILMAAGLAVLFVAFGGAYITHFMPTGRPSTYNLIIGAVVWAFALTLPITTLALGARRFARARRRWGSAVPRSGRR